MKVIENFYSENGGSRQLLTSPTEGAWSLENALDKVTLDSGPNAIYIGTGNLSSSDTKWFGKIEHEQFGNSVEGYQLEDARIESIDEGNTIFSMNFLTHPVYAAAGGTPVIDRKEEGLMGTSPSSRRLIWVKNMKATGTYATENTALLGKQIPSNDLTIYPGAVCTSEKITEKLAKTGLASNEYKPWTGSWTATEDFTNHDSEINGHLINETLADDSNDYVKQTYSWVAEKTGYDTIYVYAFRYIDDRNVTVKTIAERLGYFRLTFELETTDEMNTNLGAGKKITRKPPSGAVISDLFEKNGTLYVQYWRTTGFGHYDEWLYAIDLSQFDNMSGQTLTGQSVIAKPITPAYTEVKNYGNSYRGDNNNDWWLPSDIANGNKIGSRTKVGKDGLYSVYSNYLKWRNVDMLGFLYNGEHCSQNTVVDGVSIPKNTDNGWNRLYAEDDGDQTSRCWGWNPNDSSRQYNDSNPYAGSRIDTDDDISEPIRLGYQFGFKEN